MCLLKMMIYYKILLIFVLFIYKKRVCLQIDGLSLRHFESVFEPAVLGSIATCHTNIYTYLRY